MALDRLTKIDGGGISTTSDYRVGVITATKFVGPFEGSAGNFTGIITASGANFSGNVTIGGTLTYEDVTNIDAIGLGTFRNGIHVKTGTATTALVVEGDGRITGILTVGTSSLKLDGINNVVNVGTALTLGHSQGVQFHTQNLHSEGFEVNQINASGIITASQFKGDGSQLTGIDATALKDPAGNVKVQAQASGAVHTGIATFQDIDVDGHTNLDNVSIAGVTTMGQTTIFTTGGTTLLLKDSDSTNPADRSGIAFVDQNNTQTAFIGKESASDAVLTINNTNTVNPIRLKVNNTTRLEVGNGGVYATGSLSATGTLTAGSTLYIPDEIQHSGDADTKIRFPANDTITFETAGSNRLHIDSNGRVYMGAVTSSTGYGNQVLITGTLGLTGNGSNVGMHFHRSGGDTEGYIGIGPWAVTGGSDNDFGFAAKGDLIFGTSSNTWSQKFMIGDNGYSKFGTGTARATLDIKQGGNSWEDALLIQHDNANTGWNIHAERADSGLWFGYNSNTAAALTDQSASQVLHLNSNRTTSLVTYNSSYELTIGGISGGPTLFLRDSGTTGTPRILFGSSNGALDGGIYYKINSNYMDFYADGEPRLRIKDETIDVSTSTNTSPAYIKINSNRSSTDDTIGGVTGVWNGNPIASVNFKAGGDTSNKNEGDIMMVTYSSGTPYERLRITADGVVKIGGDVSNNADIDTANTKLTIKQTANSQEDGIYIERSGERRGFYMYVGGAGGHNDALCITTNQMGTDTHVLAIDRGNRLAKLGGDVIIDSTNNGYGGLRIYDDSSGDYNVNYVAGRNQGATAHVFHRSGRNQNQTPWTNATHSEIARLTHSSGISFQGDTNTFIGKYTQDSQPDHLRFVTGGKDRLHISKRGSIAAPKLGTKVIQWSSCNNKWASERSITQFMMNFYAGNGGATYHFMRMISQTDWGFEDVEVKQTRYQYSPDSGDHATFRYYGYYGSHVQETINYNQRNGGSGTNHSNWIGTNYFGPGGAHRIHEAANGGYYRDSYGTDFYVSLGSYIGVRLEVKIYNNSGLYDTGIYATASDFYPAAFGANATQSAADSWGGPRGIWINTTSNGTGSGTAPVISTNNADTGWSSGVNYLDVSA